MNDENLKPVEKLTPFTKMIMTIGTLPSSFYASMSYYESMVWLYEYLKNEVIPAVNNNGEAVEELQDKYIELKNYIDTYFENLDVQEEINNKLDEMAEDGSLEEIIKNYLKTFDLYISNFPKLEDETDDTQRLQRIINEGISKKNANIVIDELLHISETINIQYITGNEQITISGYNENTARNNMFYAGRWNELTNGILASGDINVFEISAPEGTTQELQGIRFNKLAIVNETYQKPALGYDSFTNTINGIVYDRATIVIDGCYFYGLNNAIYNSYTGTAYSDNLTIKNCDFHYYINSAITCSRADSGLIESCNFVPFNGYKNTMYIRGAKSLKILNITFSNWGHFVDSEWVKCSASTTTTDDTGSYLVFGYDSNISIDSVHCEFQNGSGVLFSRGSNIIANSISIPFANSYLGIARNNGTLTIENSTQKYNTSYSPWTDVYAIGSGNITIINSYRYDDEGHYYLKTSSSSSKAHVINSPIFTGRIRFTSNNKIILESAYESGNGTELTMDQYGDIKFDLSDDNIGKLAIAVVGYGNYATAKATLVNKQVTISLYDYTGTKLTSFTEGNVNLIII